MALQGVLKSVKEVRVFKLGHCANSLSQLLTLRHFAMQPIARKPISFVTVAWQPSHPDWIKVNMDGSALRSSGLLRGGGVFRNCRGLVHGCFASSFGIGFSS